MTLQFAMVNVRNGYDDSMAVHEHLWHETAGSLFVIVDGICVSTPYTPMGSRIAEEVYAHYYAHQTHDRLSALQEAFTQAHVFLRAQAPSYRASALAVLLYQQLLFIVNIGHARLYLLDRFGDFEHIGEYHLQGRLGESSGLRLETWVRTLDYHSVMLCTDGIYGYLSESEIRGALQSSPTPEQVILRLLALRAEHDGQDDATAIVIKTGMRASSPQGGSSDALAQPEPKPRSPLGELSAHAEPEKV